jgi:hypothetical protein
MTNVRSWIVSAVLAGSLPVLATSAEQRDDESECEDD